MARAWWPKRDTKGTLFDMHREQFLLDPEVTYLNHGSFGACPRSVLQAQHELRLAMEHRPIEFLYEKLPKMLDAARASLAELVHADPDGLVFVPNATTAVNAVLASQAFGAGDEILVTSHGYPACNRAAEIIAARYGAKVVTVRLPVAVEDPAVIKEAIFAAVTPKTRIAMLDAITSASAWVLPIESWVSELQSRGIDCLVDGAHAVGQLALDLNAVGAAYYTSNAHKWLCAPKGCAFLYARADRREKLKPVVISHGGGGEPDRNQLHLDFDWTGTADPTAYLTLPKAIEALQGFLPGGIAELRERNRGLALYFRRRVQEALGFRPTGSESMVGSMVSFVIPNSPQNTAVLDPLTRTMRQHGVELAAFPWPDDDCRLVRLSAQIYNEKDDVERFIEAWPRG